MKRKICVVIHNRANYARVKSVMQAIKDHPDLELQLLVGSSALLSRFGSVIDIIREDNFKENAIVHSNLEGETPTTMAKSTGVAIIELATHFENLKPDIVLTVADRFETLSTAVAASYMNIALAHSQGGEITGSIDESVRHAVSKLAHIHFPATERAKNYLLRMGEEEESVHLTGCPTIDLITQSDLALPENLFKRVSGVGDDLTTKKDYIIVLQHPVTSEYGSGYKQIQETLNAAHEVSKTGMQIVWLWPNIDAGSDSISKGIRTFREEKNAKNMHFFINFTPEDYILLLANACCIVGNSSSGLREGAFLGVPCVNIGTRQAGRERAKNVIDVKYDSLDIKTAIKYQLKHGKYTSSHLVGDGTAGKKIVEILATTKLKTQKQLSYVSNDSGVSK